MYNLYLEAEEPELLLREQQRVEARQEKRPVLPKVNPTVEEHTYREAFNSDFTCDIWIMWSMFNSDPGDTVGSYQLVDHQDMADKGYQSTWGSKKSSCHQLVKNVLFFRIKLPSLQWMLWT